MYLALSANDHLLLSEFEAARADLEASLAMAERIGDKELVLENELTRARLDIVEGQESS